MGSPIFYVASPLGERTAGPEALTQLVDAIRRRGIQAYLIAMHNFRGRRNDPEYDIYDFEVADRIAKTEDSYFVLGEVSPIESHRELRQIPDERTWMGWFSVNNSPDPRARYYRPGTHCCPTNPPEHTSAVAPAAADWNLELPPSPGLFSAEREALKRVGGSPLTHAKAVATEAVSIRFAQRVANRPIGFFAQSFYAQGFVSEVFGRSAPIITDPIRVVDVTPQTRERNLVLYNKTKSWSLVDEVIALMPEVEFRAIEGLSFQQVAQALSSATAYLELGHLPGRDRMPREAAHFGTPVVCLARGAGYCWQDVPLPIEYRVAYEQDWAPNAVRALQRVLADPSAAADEQQGYRTWVEGEPLRYEQAVDAWLELALARTS